MPSFKQKMMSVYDVSSVIHPIPEYKTSKSWNYIYYIKSKSKEMIK